MRGGQISILYIKMYTDSASTLEQSCIPFPFWRLLLLPLLLHSLFNLPLTLNLPLNLPCLIYYAWKDDSVKGNNDSTSDRGSNCNSKCSSNNMQHPTSYSYIHHSTHNTQGARHTTYKIQETRHNKHQPADKGGKKRERTTATFFLTAYR